MLTIIETEKDEAVEIRIEAAPQNPDLIREAVRRINTALWDEYTERKKAEDCPTFPTCPHTLDFNPEKPEDFTYASYLIPNEHIPRVKRIIDMALAS